jgi:hypothetical protein
VRLLSDLVSELAWPKNETHQNPDFCYPGTPSQRAQFASLDFRLKAAAQLRDLQLLARSPMIGVPVTSWSPVTPNWLSAEREARSPLSEVMTCKKRHGH